MSTFIKKLLGILSPQERRRLFVLFAAMVGVALIEMAGIASILPFMAVVANPDVIQTNRWLRQVYYALGFASLQSFLFLLGALVLIVLVLSNLFKALTAWWMLKYDNRLNYMLARRLLASYLNRPYAFFLNRNTAEMGKNVLSEVRSFIIGVLSPAVQVLSGAVIAILILGLLLVVNPFIAVIITVVLGAAYAVIYLIVRRHLARIGQDQFEANTLKYKAAAEALGGIKELKVLGRAGVFLDRFTVYARRHAMHNATAGVISQLPRYALETISFGGILLIVLHFLGTKEQVSRIVPLLALYAFAGYRLLPALQQIFVGVSAVRYNLPALEVLHRDLSEALGAIGPGLAVGDTKEEAALPFTREVALRNVIFRYPGAEEPAIEGMELTIAAGASVGLVGSTGSGKTTAVDIILGLLAPTSGEMLVDGIVIDDENLSRWQRNVGYVPQHIYLCDDTITGNIAFGVPEQEIDMEAVVRAARIANLHDFVVNELPLGFNTTIGERGVRLSGGQRQRIGIARALYRDPAVLILDEATSALDGVTEEAVMVALRTLSKEKTIIIIAHRLTTVKDCDVVCVVEHGQITMQGTYRELMKTSSWFQAAARSGT